MLVLCVLFLRLAVWQWDRAEYKRGLLKAYAEQGARPPVSLDALPAEPPPYLRVAATGHYDSGRQILLQDMTRGDEVGYEVLTPLLLRDGAIALVDRGWMPALPEAKTPPDIGVSEEQRTVVATLGALPAPGLRLGQGAKPAEGWPKLLFYPTLADLKALYGPQLMTPVLHLDPKQTDGYARELTLDVGFPPERHLGYAFQWLMLALAVFAVWLIVNLRRGKRASEKTDG
ncbi:MAG: SURF1 family protein [Bacillota bacterium]